MTTQVTKNELPEQQNSYLKLYPTRGLNVDQSLCLLLCCFCKIITLSSNNISATKLATKNLSSAKCFAVADKCPNCIRKIKDMPEATILIDLPTVLTKPNKYG
jgi:hypothetical protein